MVYGPPLEALRSEWRAVAGVRGAGRFVLKVVPDYVLRSRLWWKTTLRAADLVITDSASAAVQLWAAFRLSPRKVMAMFNGIDTDRFGPDQATRAFIRERHGIRPEERVLLMMARADRQKGMDVGIQAFREIRDHRHDCQLWVIGGGPELDPLKALASRLGVTEAVTFFGAVAPEDTLLYLNGCDLFLNPTRRVEGLPVSIVMAMACGKPVISTATGGVPDAITDGVDGLLVPLENPKAIVAAVERIFADPSLEAGLSASARRKAVENFHIDRIATKFLEVVGPLLRRSGATHG
jgi:glycosyltransferase involved in cell wall biosynthesis